MISKINGKITRIIGCEIFIFSNNIEFQCLCPRPNRLSLNLENITLNTVLIWNNENGPTICAFIEEIEKEIFNLLISCSGIGPKMAISILNNLDSEVIYDAIVNNKPKILSSVSGVGSKKAEMLIVQLKDKFQKNISILKDDSKNNLSVQIINDLASALESLGYKGNDISRAINKVSQISNFKNLEFTDCLREALQEL